MHSFQVHQRFRLHLRPLPCTNVNLSYTLSEALCRSTAEAFFRVEKDWNSCILSFSTSSSSEWKSYQNVYRKRSVTEILGLTTGYFCHFWAMNSGQKAVHAFHSQPDPAKELALCLLEVFMILLWIWSQNCLLWLMVVLKVTKSSFSDHFSSKMNIHMKLLLWIWIYFSKCLKMMNQRGSRRVKENVIWVRKYAVWI